jgi:NDP-sugar pyrophosphorylase family protein
MAYFGDGSRFGLKIDYSIEESELGTIGPLALVEDLPENFLVMNGDILSDINYAVTLRGHIQNKSEMTISIFGRESKIDFGVLSLDSEGNLASFREKPVFNFDVSMGVFCLNKLAIENLPENRAYGFDDLVLDRLAQGKRTLVQKFDGFWLDIGRTEDYQRADENFEDLMKRLGID